MDISIYTVFIFCVIFIDTYDYSSCYEYTIGDCLYQLYEPCTDTVKFSLVSRGYKSRISGPFFLDPHKPKVPIWVNMTANTKMIIHGYGGKTDTSTNGISEAYLKIPNTNIIVVNWKELSKVPCYPAAVVNTWQAGRCTAVLLSSLAALGLHPRNVHVVGFSLGAHVASYASHILNNFIGIKVGRITGLDPALPLYATVSLKPEWKLDSNDADFVDIIHTNAGIYGKLEPTGHVDFYINGGSSQPACFSEKRNRTYGSRLCSHLMAPEYFTESITSEVGFWGVSCGGYFQYLIGWCPDSAQRKHQRALMGEHTKPGTIGIYFVTTRDTAPYAQG